MYDEVIKYLGCIGVKTSMRSLKPHKRSEVAKESIKRLCKVNDIMRITDHDGNLFQEDLDKMLNETPNLKYCGMDVYLSVTSTHLELLSKERMEPIIKHEMKNVSFASNGDEETIDFVAYVAKDDEFGRACFVLQCAPKAGNLVLHKIARAFQKRTQQILYNTNTLPKTPPGSSRYDVSNFIHHTQDSMEMVSQRISNENNHDEILIATTREYLEKEPWFHGSYLSREQSETRLKRDGDFLVRESMLDPGHFVLSVMHDGVKLHLLFDSVSKVKTKEMEFDDISHLIRYHLDNGIPIVTENRDVYLRNGVHPSSKIKV